MSVDKAIELFRTEYRAAYTGILPESVLAQGNEWFEKFLRRVMPDSKYVHCPFCDLTDDFDTIGLKAHLLDYCWPFAKLERL